MCRNRWIVLVIVGVVAAGCGKPSESSKAVNLGGSGILGEEQPSQPAEPEEPAKVVGAFLDAMREGDGERLRQLLSTKAQQSAVGTNLVASDTAKFNVGTVEYVSEEAANVECTWSDLEGETQAIWGLRKESDGWRITSVVLPLEKRSLDFENPEEMARKQRPVEQERPTHAQTGEFQAQKGKNSPEPIQR